MFMNKKVENSKNVEIVQNPALCEDNNYCLWTLVSLRKRKLKDKPKGPHIGGPKGKPQTSNGNISGAKMKEMEVKNGAKFYKISAQKRENTTEEVPPSGVLHHFDEEQPKDDVSSKNQPINVVFCPKLDVVHLEQLLVVGDYVVDCG